ncbi:hypothetical protein R1flu_013682 [Riccia fluitans]|uniref:Uncharacterized protein n=1 Tax=Riccia fluitans TaxID=41844 RepID=A0ABD1YE06_9MARC
MDLVVGRGRLVEESDLPNLPYLLNDIVKEIFRLHPVEARLMVPHVSAEDCEIQGYKIPAKGILFLSVCKHHPVRDPEQCKRPRNSTLRDSLAMRRMCMAWTSIFYCSEVAVEYVLAKGWHFL